MVVKRLVMAYCNRQVTYCQARPLARGVALCIISPALLILLSGLANPDDSTVPVMLNEGVASIAGLLVLLPSAPRLP